jgi:hypothetical protein
VAILGTGFAAAGAASAQETQGSGPFFGYQSVTAVQAALQTRPKMQVYGRNGWTMIADPKSSVVWSFAPPGDPAYPAVIRRSIQREGGQLVMQTCIRCESSQAECNAASRRFQRMSAPVLEANAGD